MTFWILVVGVPAALAAIAVAFALSRKIGVVLVTCFGAILVTGGIAAYLSMRPSHVEKLVARDYEYLGRGGKLPHVECGARRAKYRGTAVNLCTIGSGSDADRVCVALFSNDRLRYLDFGRCEEQGIGD
jgi:membrane protein implicated in regulation of membrane protease activity